MNLIDNYVYEVTRRLPERSREDIGMELRSTILDMLPDHYSEEDVKEALSTLGNPAVLAASYRDTPMYLIGPKVYDSYIYIMKITIPWAVLFTVLAHVIESIVMFTGEESILTVIINTFGHIIWNVIHVLIQLFFWMTIVFIMIERIGLAKTDQPLTRNGVSWTPDDLKHIIIIPRKKAITKGENIFSLIWTLFFIVVYFSAEHIVGVYRTTDGNLEFVMPIFNQDTVLSYWPIVLLFFILEMGLTIYKWKAKQWTMNLAAVNGIIHLTSLIAFIVIASNPNLLNDAVIPYLAQVTEFSPSSVASAIKWIWWIIVASVGVTIGVEVIDSYRKAKIK